MMEGDELVHLIRHVVAQAQHAHRPFIFGHIASYDPAGHRVRCIIPSMQDDQGQPLLSPWMPMGTLSAGPGYGIQVVYRGGATIENPTGGEQVLIGRFDQAYGVTAAPALHYNNNSLPPATNLPSGAPPASPGDILVSNPSGTLLRVHANGDYEVWGTGNLIATVAGNATITVKGTASIFAAAIRLGKAAGDTLQSLCMNAFRTVFNSHVHGSSGPPSPQADSTTVTSTLTAE